LKAKEAGILVVVRLVIGLAVIPGGKSSSVVV